MARLSMFTVTNVHHSAQSWNNILATVAHAHAIDMYTNDYF